jgi:hypothetical protein
MARDMPPHWFVSLDMVSAYLAFYGLPLQHIMPCFILFLLLKRRNYSPPSPSPATLLLAPSPPHNQPDLIFTLPLSISFYHFLSFSSSVWAERLPRSHSDKCNGDFRRLKNLSELRSSLKDLI